MPAGDKKFHQLLSERNERVKELTCINKVLAITRGDNSIEGLLQAICKELPAAWQYPEHTVARIIYDDKIAVSDGFKETKWGQSESFSGSDGGTGRIDIYYLRRFPNSFEGPFLKEERDLINNLAIIIAGAISKRHAQRLWYDHRERLKELGCINRTAEILRSSSSFEEALSAVCSLLPDAWQYPEYTAARIVYGDTIFQTNNFFASKWCQKQDFVTSSGKTGTIEVYYLKEFPDDFEGPFMKEERHLINNIAGLISGTATGFDFQRLMAQNTERLKELGGINQTLEIISRGYPVEETLQRIVEILPDSWQYPNFTVARIRYAGREYLSIPGFNESPWNQHSAFTTIDNQKGTVDVFYTKQFPASDEGPFMKEERNLINNLSGFISGYLNSVKGRDILSQLPFKKEQKDKPIYSEVLERKKSPLPPLQEFFDKLAIDKYIYLDMMRYKIHEILFVATLYDAFILDNEDTFFEQFMGHIYHYSLYNLPRITAVSTSAEAMELLSESRFDLVILMEGTDKQDSFSLSREIKQKQPDIPVFLLINRSDEQLNQYRKDLALSAIDKLFVWSGESRIFFAMVKSHEDSVNVENDTRVGLVRVILLVEDSPLYYSRFLSHLYNIVFSQVQQTTAYIKSELEKISKIRSRPKILLAKNYEEAIHLFNKYKDFILCVVSDIEFERNGQYDPSAGEMLIKQMRSQVHDLPVILNSGNPENSRKAEYLGVEFLNKHSENIGSELQSFVSYHLGFGHFVFRNSMGEPLAEAQDIGGFLGLLRSVADESVAYHAQKNQFSLWLMAQGEIKLAKLLNPVQLYHFENTTAFRQYIIDAIERSIQEKKKGKIIDFEHADLSHTKNIVRLANGSLGGKGRGLAFVNTLISNLDISDYTSGINICTPQTFIIGTHEYDDFLRSNKLYTKVFSGTDIDELKRAFLNACLSSALMERLRRLVETIQTPLAVRSSSLFEDSLSQPFSGVFDTYLIPNNHPDAEKRFRQLVTAIKLVYLSVFSKPTRSYFDAIHHRIEEEKMAVVIQNVVGNRFGDYFYPHISGVAQSYNFYPFAHMKPEEGFAAIAVGLGEYVVNGQKSCRFSPHYPEIQMGSMGDIVSNTQLGFYAIDMSCTDADFEGTGANAALKFLDISEAEKHGSLTYCASSYDIQNDRLLPGLEPAMPRVIDFSNILKYNYIPLARTIEAILEITKNAMGSPVEIEFAIDLNKDSGGKASFYILQIKPLVGRQLNYDLKVENVDKDNLLLFTGSSLGNGIIRGLQDIIYADPALFDKMKTLEMAMEIEQMNKIMLENGTKYILIAPGRWGSSDRFLGIPVKWAQISGAQIIIETALDNFPLEASLGSHFFHNVVSMKVGYFALTSTGNTDFIRWDIIYSAPVVRKTKYFVHCHFVRPLEVLMDGKKRLALIRYQD